ncbi:MAG: hypothetical protein EBS84_21565, partial [Proteobacteria bacterium]|nr:hypothetical protein [Pseudomonadota bacterium]
YNYEYTFEQFACQMMGEQYKVLSDAATLANPKNTTQAFLQMLANPYRTITPDYYGSDCTNAGSAGFIHRIFRGDNALGMGRPKFLSDQMFNKPLFGSVYQSRQDWDEAGPAVGIGHSRGFNDGAPGRGVGRLLMQIQQQMENDFYAYMDLSGFYGTSAAIADIATVLGAAVADNVFDASALVLNQHTVNAAIAHNSLAERRVALAAVAAAAAVAVNNTARYFGDAAFTATQAVRNCAYESYLALYTARLIVGNAASVAALQAVNGPAAAPDNVLNAVVNAAVAVAQGAAAAGAGAGFPAMAGYAGESDEHKQYMENVATAFATAAVTQARALIAAGDDLAAQAAAALPVAPTALTDPDQYCPTLALLAAARTFVATNLLRLCNAFVTAAAGGGALIGAVVAGRLVAYTAAAPAAALFAENVKLTIRDAVIESLQRSVINFMGQKTAFGANNDSPNPQAIDRYMSWRQTLYQLVKNLPSTTDGATAAQKAVNEDGKTRAIAVERLPVAVDANTTTVQNNMIAAAGRFRELGAGGAVNIANGTAILPYGQVIDQNTIDAHKGPMLFYVLNTLDTLEYYVTKNFNLFCLVLGGGGINVQEPADDIMLAYRYMSVALWASNRHGAGNNGRAQLNRAPAIGDALPANPIPALTWWANVCNADLADRPRAEIYSRSNIRSGAGSLTWLGPEVPADDDSSAQKRTEEYEAIHKVTSRWRPRCSSTTWTPSAPTLSSSRARARPTRWLTAPSSASRGTMTATMPARRCNHLQVCKFANPRLGQ